MSALGPGRPRHLPPHLSAPHQPAAALPGWLAAPRGWFRRLRACIRPARLVDRLASADDPLLRVLFEDPAVGAALIDREGRLLRMNLLLRKLLPSADTPALGAPAALLFDPSGRGPAWEAVSRLLAARSAMPVSFASRLAGAEAAASVSVSVIPLHEADRTVSGAILRFADITLQKRLEAQLSHGQKLQAVGKLAGGIAHDFNNLLTAVLGATESIAQRPGLDAELREDLEQIRSGAQRGADLVRQLLAFGRQQTLQPRVVPVNEAISDLTGLLKRLLGETIRLELDLEPPGRSVRVDPTQFDQVIVNLAVNARDAMPRGGTLTVRTGHITLFRPLVRGAETVPPGRYVMIEVADTGVGIAPELLGRVFDPFFTTKRDGGGHGLGLSTVHGIVRQSGGYLGVASELGAGTRMRIYLPRWDETVVIPAPPRGGAARPPAADAPRAAPPPSPIPAERTPAQKMTTEPPGPEASPAAATPAAPPSPGAGRAVLLVEDEAAVRRLAERSLVRNGWLVLSAESGEAAMALLGDTPPPLAAVVTDMVMPGMDGAALVRALRERLGRPDLPALLVSGYAEETLRESVDTTATAFLPKPYSLRDLASRLAEVALAA